MTGLLYASGSNGSGQLGLPHREDVARPTEIQLPDLPPSDTPIRVAAGGNHTLVLFASGDVYAAGENRDGRCCRSTALSHGFTRVIISDAPSPLEQDRVVQFKLCSATWEASVLVTRDNRIYTAGAGSKGELGHGVEVACLCAPKPMDHFPPPGTEVVDIASSMWHTVVVLSTGEVFGWGQGRHGQLGAAPGLVWSPRRIAGLAFKAVRAVCGREFTFIVGDPVTGEHVLLGSDKWRVRSAAPELVSDWKDVRASWGSIYILYHDNTVRSWGRDDHGQLAPRGLLPVCVIAAGSEHALAISLDHRLWAWGWGEHGNCGNETDEAGDVKNGSKEISVGLNASTRGAVCFIGAGCATSWVWCASRTQ
ncbi:MAG: hypothetical protein M1826_001910 [Phylliscum demangeonii]|nr:MAG: hypothetical protein M1826_001910 [Phylliscum demangeonii]